MTRVLLVTPPMVQLNGPYPATPYLTALLRGRGVDARQVDLSIELALRLFSSTGCRRVLSAIGSKRRGVSESVRFFLDNADQVIERADATLAFLQGRDLSMAHRIASRTWLPEGPRFKDLILRDEADPEGDSLYPAFGSMGTVDRARFVASLFLDDVGDAIRDGVDARFGVARYAERLAVSAPSFDGIAKELGGTRTLLDDMITELVETITREHHPDVIALTAPFPGNVYGAFRIAGEARRLKPDVITVLGGGYVNTELRETTEGRIFDWFDYVTLDDGFGPLMAIVEAREGRRPATDLVRTHVRRDGRVVTVGMDRREECRFGDWPAPVHDGLPLDRYLAVCEMLNPMHRLWSSARWNKIMVAHGCYWKKCAFCDTSLDYIARFEPMAAARVVDHMEAILAETGTRGFHLVDEAAPPALLAEMSREIIRRGLSVSWWGNVRFDKAFTPELAALMARAGCIAVTGGLEAASDRLLKLMNKGVSVAQVARVTHAFASEGILTHAYLIHGFPTQTEQETIDALERVRQLFAAGCIHSAYWHRFALTAHSPVAADPEAFGVRIVKGKGATFARNEVAYVEKSPVDHDALGAGLAKAVYNYMHGIGLDRDVRGWFSRKVPAPRVRGDLVERCLEGEEG